MRAFERPGQSLKRLPAADTARGGNCGLGHAVVGRRYGGRNHIGLRHGAALPEPSDNGGLRGGIVARHAGCNLCEKFVVAFAERLQGGITVFGRPLLDGLQHVRHRLPGTEGIDQNRERTAADVLEVAFEQSPGGLYGPASPAAASLASRRR